MDADPGTGPIRHPVGHQRRLAEARPGDDRGQTPGRSIVEPQVRVAVVASQGTLPSENLPMLSAHGAVGARGVAVWAVVVLVVGSLVAGFALGLATARLF